MKSAKSADGKPPALQPFRVLCELGGTPALMQAGGLLPRAFFEAPPERVAPRLLGKVLVHRTAAGCLAGRIVEVEAYLGPHNDPPDPAAHSHRGPTPRNRVLFGPPGHAYVYSIYGRYFCMNVTCEIEGKAGGVLLRALEPWDADLAQMAVNRGLAPGAKARELTAGPSRLCQALGLTRLEHNALDLLDPASPLQLRDDGFRAAKYWSLRGSASSKPSIGRSALHFRTIRVCRGRSPGPSLLGGNEQSFIGKRVFIR